MTATRQFDLKDPLPIGRITLIEASAGTGKTYTLAALTALLVAEEDMHISEVLLATFNTAAASELRERIRGVLIEAASHLVDPKPGSVDLLDRLADASPAERERRLGRLERSIRDFDSASISTIHGFCAGVLETRGALANNGPGPDSVLVSETELISQVCSDLLFTHATSSAEDTEFPALSTLKEAVTTVRNLGECQVLAESKRPVDELLAELARRAADEVDRRLEANSKMSFSSMISSVRDLVRQDTQLVGELRRRFKVALIDEFQDTDPVQWEIFRTVFGAGDPAPTLMMVGDPKQAIYGFRGGDVYTYLQARDGLSPLVLGTNHRSIPQVVRAMNSIGAGHFFGEKQIAYQQVAVSPRNAGRRLVLNPNDTSDAEAPGLHVRCVNDATSFPVTASSKKPNADQRRELIAADLAGMTVELLTTAQLSTETSTGVEVRALLPGDIAVLVGSAAAADPVADELALRGVPSVKLMSDSVLRSEAATQWQILLGAMESPSDPRRAGAAVLSWFFGWSADSLASAVASDPDRLVENTDLTRLIEVQYQLADWARIIETIGFSALFTEIRRTSELIPLLLSKPDGERNLTDLEHIAELLNSESQDRSWGMSATQALEHLTTWMLNTDEKDVADHLQRRVESDDVAVRIMTVHRAKGLEFPVVLLPDLASGGNRVKSTGPLSYFDGNLGKRVLDVSTKREAGGGEKEIDRSKLAPNATRETKRQNCGDQHRLTYVALTRASCLTITWWTAFSGCKLTGLARLLFGVEEEAGADASVTVPEDGDVVERLKFRFDSLGAGDSIRVSAVPAPTENPQRYVSAGTSGRSGATEATSSGPALAVGELHRRLDRAGLRWSFSSLKDTVRNVLPGSGIGGDRTDPGIENSDDRGAGDEIAESVGFDSAVSRSGAWAAPTLFEGLGAGTEFGTMVHGLYEEVDFTDPDSESAFRRVMEDQLLSAVTPEQRERLPWALAQTLVTPLGASFGGLRLADLSAADRLNELDFYIPLAPGGIIAASRIGRIVQDHLDSGHPLQAWADQLARGLAHIDLTGYLSGAIDLIFRYQADGQTRYSVLDYKTNRLSGSGGSSVGDYHPERLVSAMEHSQYLLQALIYSVALHRYLRLRVPDYRASTHLGPVAYAFLRGMVGAAAPVADDGFWKGSTAGVFAWDIPTSMIEALSDAFDNDLRGEEER